MAPGLIKEPRAFALRDDGERGREIEVGAKGFDEILALVLVGVRDLRDDLGDDLELLITGIKEGFLFGEDEPHHAVC